MACIQCPNIVDKLEKTSKSAVAKQLWAIIITFDTGPYKWQEKTYKKEEVINR